MRAKGHNVAIQATALRIAVVFGICAMAVPALAQSDQPAQPVLPPIDTLSETVERPLFLPDRRPPTIDEAAEESENAESGLFTLVGIIVSPTQRIALVKVSGSQDVLQLSEGQQANGWTVLQIRPEEVIFESNDKTETIELIDIKAPKARRRPVREQRSQPPQNNEPRRRVPTRVGGEE